MSKVPSVEAVSTPPVPRFCRRSRFRTSSNLENKEGDFEFMLVAGKICLPILRIAFYLVKPRKQTGLS